jgi:hypothetical protein
MVTRASCILILLVVATTGGRAEFQGFHVVYGIGPTFDFSAQGEHYLPAWGFDLGLAARFSDYDELSLEGFYKHMEPLSQGHTRWTMKVVEAALRVNISFTRTSVRPYLSLGYLLGWMLDHPDVVGQGPMLGTGVEWRESDQVSLSLGMDAEFNRRISAFFPVFLKVKLAM